jgi:hypothetical protein
MKKLITAGLDVPKGDGHWPRKRHGRRAIVRTALAILTMSGCCVAQSAREFEVASIKLNRDGGRTDVTTSPGGRLNATNVLCRNNSGSGWKSIRARSAVTGRRPLLASQVLFSLSQRPPYRTGPFQADLKVC